MAPGELFNKDRAPSGEPNDNDPSGTFPVRLTGISAAAPPSSPPDGQPRKGVPAIGFARSGSAPAELPESQNEDDPLYKAHVPPEHEAFLRRVFQRD